MVFVEDVAEEPWVKESKGLIPPETRPFNSLEVELLYQVEPESRCVSQFPKLQLRADHMLKFLSLAIIFLTLACLYPQASVLDLTIGLLCMSATVLSVVQSMYRQ